MQRSPLALAALATVAVPGFDIYQARKAPAPDGFEAAYVLDDHRRTWVVRAPQSAVSGAALEAETAFLRDIAPHVDSGKLPFVVPRPAGFAPLIGGGRAVVYPHIPGNQLRLERLAPGPGASASLGRAIGAIHELPVRILEESGFPSYTTEQYRDRKLSELDEGAATGLVPVPLLRRWEGAIENVALWRFAPVITHTGLSEESVIMAHGQVSGIIDWSTVQVGDPADDLAWLVAAAPMDCVDSIFEAYQMRRSEALDPHLVDRALLGSELALLKWLLHGTRKNDSSIVDDAKVMLDDLLEATTQSTQVGSSPTGSFTISTIQSTPDRAPVERMIGDTGAQEVADGTHITSSFDAPITDDSPASSQPSARSNSVLDESLPLVESAENGDRSERLTGVNAGNEPPADRELLHSASNDADAVRVTLDASESADIEQGIASGEFLLPDYDHSIPPKPYADSPTEMMKVLPESRSGSVAEA